MHVTQKAEAGRPQRIWSHPALRGEFGAASQRMNSSVTFKGKRSRRLSTWGPSKLGNPPSLVLCGCHTVWASAMELSEQCVVEGLSGTIPPTEIFMDQDLGQQDKVRGL